MRVKAEAKRANRWREKENVRQRRPQRSRESQWRLVKLVPKGPIDDLPMVNRYVICGAVLDLGFWDLDRFGLRFYV